MHNTALLLLSGPFRAVVESISKYLISAKKTATKCLYIKLEPDFPAPISKAYNHALNQLSYAVPLVYSEASVLCKDMDIRIILTSLNKSETMLKNSLHFDVVMTNSCETDRNILNYLTANFSSKTTNLIKIENFNASNLIDDSSPEFQAFDTVCLGGTFDRLHNGHKVLLSEGILRAKSKLIVGVSVGSLIQKKLLWELIEPIEKRMKEVERFLTEVDPTLCYEILPITDPYGPTITQADIDCLLVTTETKIGGDKVNCERKKRDMSELPIRVVELVENTEHTSEEEEKLSSSTNRMHLLGKNLKPIQGSPESSKPYSILLRGCPLKDKSYFGSRLQSLGIPVLCCDEIFIAIVNKDIGLQKSFIEEFPENSFNLHFPVHLNDLFKLCLNNKKIKEWFLMKVYDKMISALQQVLEVYSSQGSKLIIVKDSSVFEGGNLDIHFQEIWALMLPFSECVNRFKEEFQCGEDEAIEMRKYFPSNEEYVTISNRLFCDMWSPSTTQKQVERAWNDLKSSI